jgi:hypothetical protein
MAVSAAVITVVGAGCATPGRGPADVDSKGPVKLSEKHYTDPEGRKMVVRFDGPDKVTVHATDREGKPLEVTEIPLSHAQLCLLSGEKKHCVPVSSVPEGVFMQLGAAPEGGVAKASLTSTPYCNCFVIGNSMRCIPPGCIP